MATYFVFGLLVNRILGLEVDRGPFEPLEKLNITACFFFVYITAFITSPIT